MRAAHRVAQNLFVRGLLAASEDRVDDALVALDDAVARFESCESRAELARALESRATILDAQGRASAARQDRARAADLLGEPPGA